MTTRSSRVGIDPNDKQFETDESAIQSQRTREALQRAVHYATEYLDGLNEGSVAATTTYEDLRSRLSRPLSDEGMDSCQVVDQLVSSTAGGHLASAGGRFFAWVIGGSLPSALAADWLTSAWDQAAGMYACGPAAAVVSLRSTGTSRAVRCAPDRERARWPGFPPGRG